MNFSSLNPHLRTGLTKSLLLTRYTVLPLHTWKMEVSAICQGLRHKWMLTPAEHYAQNLVKEERGGKVPYI